MNAAPTDESSVETGLLADDEAALALSGSDLDIDADVAPADDPRCASRTCASPVTEAQLAAWIAAIARQDERALGALYDATFSRIYGFVRRLVRKPVLAEEVVEDAYFQVWRQALRYDATRGTAMVWLLSMARSRAIDALRREARFQHDSLDDDGAEALGGVTLPDDEWLDVARHHAELHRALMRIGAQPRQLVSLAFFRGLSHEEIAAQTAIPLGTVKSQIRRALITLRQLLGEARAAALAA